MTNEEKDKKEYELAILVKSEEEVAPVVALVSQHHGEGASEPRAKRLNFAYEVKGVREGVFAYFTFKAYGDDIKTLESDLNTRGQVLRFLVIASPAPMERPTSMPSYERPSRAPRQAAPMGAPSEPRERAPLPLSNEALEKKIEEILK